MTADTLGAPGTTPEAGRDFAPPQRPDVNTGLASAAVAAKNFNVEKVAEATTPEMPGYLYDLPNDVADPETGARILTLDEEEYTDPNKGEKEAAVLNKAAASGGPNDAGVAKAAAQAVPERAGATQGAAPAEATAVGGQNTSPPAEQQGLGAQPAETGAAAAPEATAEPEASKSVDQKIKDVNSQKAKLAECTKQGYLGSSEQGSLDGQRPHDVLAVVQNKEKPLSDDEQKRYDKYVGDIKGKVEGGKKLTKKEAKDYEEHLERQKDAAMDGEAAEIGKSLDADAITGQVSKETQDRLNTFIDTVTGGKGLIKSLFDFGNMSDKERYQIAKKIKGKLDKLTPSIAKEINEKLQILMQLECQLHNARKQKAEAQHCAHDVKDFLNEHKDEFKPVEEAGRTDEKALQNRIKWTKAVELLNNFKAAVAKAENSGLLLVQEYRSAKAFVDDKLGINPDTFFKKTLRFFKGQGEFAVVDMATDANYKDIEGETRPLEGRDKHKKLDLSGLVPA